MDTLHAHGHPVLTQQVRLPEGPFVPPPRQYWVPRSAPVPAGQTMPPWTQDRWAAPAEERMSERQLCLWVGIGLGLLGVLALAAIALLLMR